ncbi:hypothetical protein IWW56_003197 [Coemansia sp. RSA 2131]|nr:hypothetical protein IWW56_003197 [Coemansia sp. RSA 2131]
MTIMIIHQAGMDQETADWLSFAKEHLRPVKARVLLAQEATIGDDNVEYTVGYLSDSESSGEGVQAPAAQVAEAAGVTDSEQQLAVLAQAVHPDSPADYWDCQLTHRITDLNGAVPAT